MKIINTNVINAIETIINEDEQVYAINLLTQSLDKRLDITESKLENRNFCLRAIRKINKNKNKDIDSLCDYENDDNEKEYKRRYK